MNNFEKIIIAKQKQDDEKDILFMMKNFQLENYTTEKLEIVKQKSLEYEQAGGSNANRRMLEAIRRLQTQLFA